MNEKIPFEKSFASNEKAKFWSNKNTLNPRQIFKSSNKKFIFNCNNCNHEFDIALNKVNCGNWCSYCCSPPKKLCENIDCKDCLNKSFASNNKSKYWSSTNELNPRQVFNNSGKKYWFNCLECNHSFDCKLDNINKGRWCPYCCNPPKKICNNENCNLCFEKSFESNAKSEFWSNKNQLKPREVFLNCNKKFIFNCNNCNHEFEKQLNSINQNNGLCPYCVNQKICSNLNCKNCLDNSFASHPKSKYWSNKNQLKPREVFLNCNKKFIFNCDICNHEFERYLPDIKYDSTHCTYCCLQSKLLCNDNNCKHCFEKSFNSHPKSKYWSDKNYLKSRDVFKSSNNKYIFICDNNHEFDIALNNVYSGNWCRFCVNKTEQKLFDNLILLYPNLIQQYKVEWCKNITYLPFDFCIKDLKIIIELDGRQHFEQVSNWTSPEDTQKNDKFKMNSANDNKYSVIRILQYDVFYDTFNWIEEIKISIQKIIDDKIIQNIFICKNNEYIIFN